MNMLHIQFVHDTEQLFEFKHPNFGLLKRIELALMIIFNSKVSIHTFGDAKRRSGGIQYKV